MGFNEDQQNLIKIKNAYSRIQYRVLTLIKKFNFK